MQTPVAATPTAGTPDDADASPARSIVLCAVPGAGETQVSDLLRRCGAGDVHPYFDLDRVAPALLAEWEIDHLDQYIAALHRHRSTTDGVFGLLLRWHDIRRLLARVMGPRQSTPRRVLDVIEVIAPEPTFVRLRRTERAQHVLALRAWQERSTRSGDDQRPPPPTDPERLTALVDATEAVWTQWFDAVGIAPVEVVYEELIDDPAAQDALVARLGLTPPSGADGGPAPMPVAGDAAGA
ncbi:MAG: hypothetical protein KY460_04930 [Actinobacteria bacterium]|nr:hypothetical protein [Actinomycetota bacterium]